MTPQQQPQQNNSPQQRNTQQISSSVDLNSLKGHIEGYMPKYGYQVRIGGDTVTFKGNYAEVMIPDKILSYYYSLIHDNIQKSGDYEAFRNELKELLKSNDIEQLLRKEKEITKSLIFSEIANVFNFQSNILADNKTDINAKRAIDIAYNTEVIDSLSQGELAIMLSNLKKSLTYSDVLINLYYAFTEFKEKNKK